MVKIVKDNEIKTKWYKAESGLDSMKSLRHERQDPPKGRVRRGFTAMSDLSKCL